MKSSSNFSKNLIPKINNAIKFVINNPYSSFYKKKYDNFNIGEIETYEDFQKIPFLKKKEFADLPIKKRIFIPEKDIGAYSFSSGTTGSGKPTVMPKKRTDFSSINRAKEEKLSSLGVKNLMVLLPPTSGGFVSLLKTKTEKIVIIPADITKLYLSAQMAKETGTQALYTNPTMLYYFIKNLEKVNFNLKNIKFISLGGEFCTTQKYNFLKNKFPQAVFEFRYFNSMVDPRGRGYRCQHLSKEEPSVFHPSKECLTEIVKDNKTVSPGVVGEIVQTHLSPGAFPLIRYKTGDIGSLSIRACECGNDFLLTLGGKEHFDVLRFSGISLTADNISKSLQGLENFIEPNFQAHVFEELIADKIFYKLALHLTPRDKIKEEKNNQYWKDILTQKISPNLKMSAGSTLKSLVEKNVFLPLEIIWIEENKKDVKSKNIISHLN